MRLPLLVRLGFSVWLGATLDAQRSPTPASEAHTSSPSSSTQSLDLATFRDRVQPVFLNKRAGFARCYICHSQGTTFRLQRMPEGRTTWNEEETRKNFDAIQRLIAPGKPEASRFLLMPLAHEAGGTEFHPGGKRWASQDDPEWKEIAQWIRNASR